MSSDGFIAYLQALIEMTTWREGVEGAALYLAIGLLHDTSSRARRPRRDERTIDGPDESQQSAAALRCVACAGSLGCEDAVALGAALRTFWGSRATSTQPNLASLSISRRGEPIGAVVARIRAGLAPGDVERQVLRPTARIAARLLSERWTEREVSRQSTLLRALDEVGAAVERASTDDSVLETVFTAGVQALRCDTASLFVFDSAGEKLRLVAGKNLPSDAQGRTFRLGEGIAGWVAAHGQTVLVPDVRLDPRYQLPGSGLDAPRSLLVVPLRLYGEVIACLSFARRGTSAFRHSDQELAERIAVYAAQSLAHARLTKLETQADVLRRRFETLSAVSHDIRAELSQIKLIAKLAQHSEATEDRDVYLQQLIGKVDGISSLLNAGLITARLETELTRLQTERVNLPALVNSVVDDARLLAGPERTFGVQIPANAVVRADQVQLRRVLANLLDNAIKYTSRETPIQIGASLEPNCVRLSVRDEGEGIPLEDQARIFQPFQRASGQSRAPGFGLGLYVCWRIVEAHGGRIAVESQPGKGSVFHIDLPLNDSGSTDYGSAR